MMAHALTSTQGKWDKSSLFNGDDILSDYFLTMHEKFRYGNPNIILFNPQRRKILGTSEFLAGRCHSSTLI
jgi:hypothetical protein